MKRSTLRIGAVLIAANGIVLQASRAAEPSAEDNAIRQSARAFAEAFDSGNAAAVAALWTDDGEYIVGQTTVKGRPTIERLYAEFFRAHPGARMEVRVDSIRTLRRPWRWSKVPHQSAVPTGRPARVPTRPCT